MIVHLFNFSVATFCAQCHFRLLCSVIQSSMPSAFIWSSASCVHLFIHATQVSVVSSLSIVVVGMLSCCSGLLSTSSGSESESVVVLSLWVVSCGGCCSWASVCVGVVSPCVVGCLLLWVVLSCRLGQLTIMRSICRCVRRSLFSKSVVKVHVELP